MTYDEATTFAIQAEAESYDDGTCVTREAWSGSRRVYSRGGVLREITDAGYATNYGPTVADQQATDWVTTE